MQSLHHWRKRVSRDLLAWYLKNRRDLPWRRSPTAYRVWVSEVMLQQTQVDTVLPYYRRFMKRFPSLGRLAAASEDEVLSLWSGLGYYRRGRNLHRAAREVVERFRGRFPRDVDAALSLPGIGRYTAGAILSIAYNLPTPIVDGNVERVLTRLLELAGDPRKKPLKGRIWSEAETMIPEARAGDFNQSLMELGALVCLPQSPRCPECPLRRYCHAHAAGDPTRYPEKAAPKKTVKLELGAVVLTRGSRVLVTRSPEGKGLPYLRGIWNVPIVELERGEDASDRLCELMKEETGRQISIEKSLGTVNHAITFRRLTVHAFKGRVANGSGQVRGRGKNRQSESGREWHWAAPEELGTRFAVPSLARKILACLAK